MALVARRKMGAPLPMELPAELFEDINVNTNTTNNNNNDDNNSSRNCNYMIHRTLSTYDIIRPAGARASRRRWRSTFCKGGCSGNRVW